MSTPDEAEKPGKTRTWWHPLLARLLSWQMSGQYQLFEEVNVGQKPLQIDILLVQKEQQGELPEEARKILAGLAEHLNDYTLVELKGPSDTLRAGGFQAVLAYALVYRAQNFPLLDPGRLSVIVIAPWLSKPYAEEMRLLGVTPRKQEDGVWQLDGPTLGHAMWLLETEVLWGTEHPEMSLVSRKFLDDVRGTYDKLSAAGYTDLVVYMIQQVQQFQRLGRDFAMQHLGAEDELMKVLEEINAALPPERRLVGMSDEDRLAGLSPERRLAGLPPEQRVAGLSPEQRLAGLSPEERDRLKELLKDPPKANGSSTKE